LKKEEFISLIKVNRNLIYKICVSYCKDEENRKDLEQEILLQLWKSLKSFDGRVKITTWMYRIGLNTAISFYRNENKGNVKKIQLDESIITLSIDEYNPEKDQNIILLYQFIEKLGEMDKALILLYLDDVKHKDIAEILGISESNVATKISRIKLTLKDQFKTI